MKSTPPPNPLPIAMERGLISPWRARFNHRDHRGHREKLGGFGAEGQFRKVFDDVDGAQADGDDALDEFENVLRIVAVAVGIVGGNRYYITCSDLR